MENTPNTIMALDDDLSYPFRMERIVVRSAKYLGMDPEEYARQHLEPDVYIVWREAKKDLEKSAP